ARGGSPAPPLGRARVVHGTAAGATGARARTAALHLTPVTRDPATPFVPAEISHVCAAVLVVTRCPTSALPAAMGLGGGVARLAVLSLGLPVTSVLPVHGVVQMGSNGGRVIIQRRHLVLPVLLWFSLGSIVGIALGASVVVNIPDALAKWLLALFILWSV